MKRRLSFIASCLVLLFLGSACTYSPTQSWTPRHNKATLSKKKSKTPKKKKKDKTLIVRMW